MVLGRVSVGSLNMLRLYEVILLDRRAQCEVRPVYQALISSHYQLPTGQNIQNSKLIIRTLNLALPYILHLVTLSPSTPVL
jgi:hypothetical protein